MENNRENTDILEMDQNDLKKISKNYEKCFENHWSYDILITDFENTNTKYFVLKQKKEIIGFVSLYMILDHTDITNIVIHKNYRSLGLSNLLMEFVINYLTNKNIKIVTLEVNVNNEIAIHLYKKFHFLEIARRKNYYHNTEDAIIMQRSI